MIEDDVSNDPESYPDFYSKTKDLLIHDCIECLPYIKPREATENAKELFSNYCKRAHESNQITTLARFQHAECFVGQLSILNTRPN